METRYVVPSFKEYSFEITSLLYTTKKYLYKTGVICKPDLYAQGFTSSLLGGCTFVWVGNDSANKNDFISALRHWHSDHGTCVHINNVVYII